MNRLSVAAFARKYGAIKAMSTGVSESVEVVNSAIVVKNGRYHIAYDWPTETYVTQRI